MSRARLRHQTHRDQGARHDTGNKRRGPRRNTPPIPTGTATIARLLRAGVRIENWLGLHGAADGRVNFRSIFAADLETSIGCDVLALSLGRVPNQRLEAELRIRGLSVTSAGDCRSPRGLEEAILEGTLAGARLGEVRSRQAVG